MTGALWVECTSLAAPMAVWGAAGAGLLRGPQGAPDGFEHSGVGGHTGVSGHTEGCRGQAAPGDRPGQAQLPQDGLRRSRCPRTSRPGLGNGEGEGSSPENQTEPGSQRGGSLLGAGRPEDRLEGVVGEGQREDRLEGLAGEGQRVPQGGRRPPQRPPVRNTGRTPQRPERWVGGLSAGRSPGFGKTQGPGEKPTCTVPGPPPPLLVPWGCCHGDSPPSTADKAGRRPGTCPCCSQPAPCAVRGRSFEKAERSLGPLPAPSPVSVKVANAAAALHGSQSRVWSVSTRPRRTRHIQHLCPPASPCHPFPASPCPPRQASPRQPALRSARETGLFLNSLEDSKPPCVCSHRKRSWKTLRPL